jgi:cob(I)alamin adenosyltransferase
MKLYTKTGDDGTTGLLGGARVSKASARVEAFGTVDETNAALGSARAWGLDLRSDAVLGRVQASLFSLGAELACAPGRSGPIELELVDERDIAGLEKAIDEAAERCPPLTQFILPGGSRQAASLHVARTVCRRAERLVVALSDPAPRQEVVVYLNRLSDLLFALARVENLVNHISDIAWSGALRRDDRP